MSHAKIERPLARVLLGRRPMHTLTLAGLVLTLSRALPLAACSSVIVDPDAVSATIVDDNGAPIVGSRVAIGDAILTTDAEGHCEAPAVAGAYNLTVRPTDDESASIFVGLLDHEPTIQLRGTVAPAPDPQARSADIVVTFPEKDGDSMGSTIILDALDTTANGVAESANPTNPLEKTTSLQWTGSASSKAHFQAFRCTIDPVTKAPKHYVGYDSAEVMITSGAQTAWAVSWKAPPFGESTVSFPAHRSAGEGDVSTLLRMQSAGAHFAQRLATGTTSGAEVTFVVPALAGASFTALVTTGNVDEGGSLASVPQLLAGVEGATVELPSFPVLTSPTAGDTSGAGSDIRWSTDGTGATLVSIRPADFFSHDARYFIATRGGAAVVPVLAALGLHLPGGVKYKVSVERDSWSPTVDGFAETPWEASFEKKPHDVARSAEVGIVTR